MFRTPRLIVLTAIGMTSLVVASCKSGATNPGAEVVAKVGSREVQLKQVDSVIKQQLDANPGTALSPSELAAARLTVLDNLIQEEAMFQKAQKENLVPDDNKVTQEIQKTKQTAGLTEEQYKEQIKQAGLTEEDIREKARRTLAINDLLERQKTRVTAPTDADIEKYYSEHKAELVAERGADISIIVTDPVNNSAADDAIGDAAAEQKIKAIYEQLKNRADFATIARQRSEDQSATRDGALGFGSETALKQTFPTRPDLPQRLMSMSAGDITEPIKDNLSGRWVIIKVNGVRQQAQNLSLADVRKNIIDAITQQRQQILLQALKMVAMAEVSVKNLFAERIVNNPQTIVELRPSPLLEQSNSTQTQQQPRIENENQNKPASRDAANANKSGASNTNSAGGNANRRTAAANK